MNPLLTAALKEFKDLRDQKLVIERRMSELEQFLKVAGSIKLDLSGDAPTRAKSQETLKARILRVAESLLSRREHVQTREIIDALQSQEGFIVSGTTETVKIQMVSALLSKSDRFISDRTKGWSLKKPRKDEAEVAASASGSASPVGGQPALADTNGNQPHWRQ